MGPGLVLVKNMGYWAVTTVITNCYYEVAIGLD
jgi:hypothetical protein